MKGFHEPTSSFPAILLVAVFGGFSGREGPRPAAGRVGCRERWLPRKASQISDTHRCLKRLRSRGDCWGRRGRQAQRRRHSCRRSGGGVSFHLWRHVVENPTHRRAGTPGHEVHSMLFQSVLLALARHPADGTLSVQEWPDNRSRQQGEGRCLPASGPTQFCQATPAGGLRHGAGRQMAHVARAQARHHQATRIRPVSDMADFR